MREALRFIASERNTEIGCPADSYRLVQKAAWFIAVGVEPLEKLRSLGPAALFDPVTNVQIGVVYLRQLLDRYKNVAVALAAYNWGPTRIAERLRQGEPVPALYARRVLSVYEEAMLEPLQI